MGKGQLQKPAAVEAAGAQTKDRVWAREEVEAAVASGRHMYLYKGSVYDVNVDELMHPGGRELLEDHRGQDITDVFNGGGSLAHSHSKGARAMLASYRVGRLEGSAAQQQQQGQQEGSVDGLVDESAPLLPQVVKLAPRDYMAWIAAPSTGHPVMFANPLMERMTCTAWYVVPLLWLPVAAALMWRGAAAGGLPLSMLPVALVVGVLVWQLIEYSIHRFLFHFDPQTPSGIEWHFMLHGHHHKYPMDVDRLVFPPAIAAVVIAAFYALLHALLPMAWASALLGGGVAGYVLYDTTHWALHSGRMDWLVGGVLKSSHMEHHYRDETVGYGISSTLYDHVFATMSRHLLKKAA